jgi:type IV secretory system conjugative DNA transfer VirD4/TraG family protein
MSNVGPRFKPLSLGTEVNTGEPVSLRQKWFETHFHVLGPPDSGKTRLLLWIFQYLARIPRATVVLVNPKGALARMARDWALGHGMSKRLVWFDPGDPQFAIGYNPLSPNGLPVATHAKAVREAVRSAWGQSSFDQTPQLARLLYMALAVSLSLGNTLFDALRLLRSGPEGSRVRKALLRALASGAARGERDLIAFLEDALASFDSVTERRQEELSASALARLESFVCDPVISRIMTQPRCLNLADLIAEHKILLVNLEIGRPLRMDDIKLMGRFLVNDIVNHVFSRPPSPGEPVYLILDEVQNFATRDLCSILDMGRELGLHCVMAHQTLGQLRAEDETGYLYSSVQGCARTKFYFGGSSVEDLEVLVKDACIEQFDPYKVKDELKTLLLDPIESRRTVVTRGFNVGTSLGTAHGTSHARNRVNSIGFSSSEGESFMDGTSDATGFSSGHVSGRQFGLGGREAILPSGEVTGTSEADIESRTDLHSQTHAEGFSSSHGVHASQAEGEAEGTQDVLSFNLNTGVSVSSSDVPFYEYKKLWRVSSRTFESEQEFLTTNLQKIKSQQQAQVFLKVPGKAGCFLALPWVRTPLISARARSAGLEKVFDQPYYARLGIGQIPERAHEHAAPRAALVAYEETVSTAPKLLPATTADQFIVQEPNTIDPVRGNVLVADADENFAGPEILLKPRTPREKNR